LVQSGKLPPIPIPITRMRRDRASEAL